MKKIIFILVLCLLTIQFTACSESVYYKSGIENFHVADSSVSLNDLVIPRDFLKTYPVQFRRQYQIGYYYVDFFCYKAKLIVELDGSQHCSPEVLAYDKARTDFLQEQGFFVQRFSNLDVMKNFQAVCEAIHQTVEERMQG